jgi:HemY protein
LPHPELAFAYAHLRPGDSAEDRLKRVRKLAKKKPDDAESILALSRAAFEANRFDEARKLLDPLLGDPTQRACLLMAEIEAAEHGDHGKAREWTIRALRAKHDPAWIADGYVSQEWLPASPRTGELDAFRWSVPDAAGSGQVLEQAAEKVLTVPPPVLVREAAPEREPVVRAAPAQKSVAKPAPIVAEPPLPDDPGPETETDEDTVSLRRGF